MLKAVLFDLDGTLLPMESFDRYIRAYFTRMQEVLAESGYAPDMLYRAMIESSRAMIDNDGSRTNEEVYWEGMARVFGEQVREDEELFLDFYRKHYEVARRECGYDPEAARVVEYAKSLGLRVILATNPLFPSVATYERMRWAGFAPEDFELVTTYENSGAGKPNPYYYRELLEKLSLAPEECLMVGNDTIEDLAAEEEGIPVFFLTYWLINKPGLDLSDRPHGGYAELRAELDRRLAAQDCENV